MSRMKRNLLTTTAIFAIDPWVAVLTQAYINGAMRHGINNRYVLYT